MKSNLKQRKRKKVSFLTPILAVRAHAHASAFYGGKERLFLPRQNDRAERRGKEWAGEMDLPTALRPGSAGVSYESQIALALAYWQAIAASATPDAAAQALGLGGAGAAGSGGDTVVAANAAVTLLQTEQTRVERPGG